VIFHAKNEEGTIERAISTAKQSYFKPEILVVDAYSTDKTSELAMKAGAGVIQQLTQVFPGNGLAMKTGLKEAIERSQAATDIILFLDADIRNLTLERVDNLVRALIDDNYAVLC
jgi:glycosyltransferase involved in cell wall biosynthesis